MQRKERIPVDIHDTRSSSGKLSQPSPYSISSHVEDEYPEYDGNIYQEYGDHEYDGDIYLDYDVDPEHDGNIHIIMMWTLNMTATFTRIMMLTLNMAMKFMIDMETLNMRNSDIYKEIIWTMPGTTACKILKNNFSFYFKARLTCFRVSAICLL